MHRVFHLCVFCSFFFATGLCILGDSDSYLYVYPIVSIQRSKPWLVRHVPLWCCSEGLPSWKSEVTSLRCSASSCYRSGRSGTPRRLGTWRLLSKELRNPKIWGYSIFSAISDEPFHWINSSLLRGGVLTVSSDIHLSILYDLLYSHAWSAICSLPIKSRLHFT